MADDGSTIRFNKADYDHLIQTVTADEADLERRFLRPRSGMMMDASLERTVKPAAAGWDPVKEVKASAKTFGESVNKQFTGFCREWEDFVADLKGVEGVFKENADLALMSAQDFMQEYPDFGPDGS
jgi:hypothetical protein